MNEVDHGMSSKRIFVRKMLYLPLRMVNSYQMRLYRAKKNLMRSCASTRGRVDVRKLNDVSCEPKLSKCDL